MNRRELKLKGSLERSCCVFGGLDWKGIASCFRGTKRLVPTSSLYSRIELFEGSDRLENSRNHVSTLDLTYLW